MTRTRKSLGALVLAGGLAAVAFTAGSAQANETIDTYNKGQSGSYNDGGRTGQYQFQLADEDQYGFEQSNVWVSGGDGGYDRADCIRGNGGTNWYQSTIFAVNGENASHYDCANNGTYNRGINEVGVDLEAN